MAGIRSGGKMGKFADTVQKRIGLMISIIGLSMVITNIINRTIRVDFIYAVTGISVILLFLQTVPFIVSVFIENRFLKYLQVAMFFAVGVINIMESGYREFYGPAMFLAAWLLMRHYGFLERAKKVKNAAILIVLVGLSQLSAALQSDESIYAGLTTLLYTLFLILLILIIWRDMVRQQEELKKENHSLKIDYKKLAAELKEIEDEQKPYNLKAVKITPAEERVIKVLTVYKASNREIAERLDLAESTVKLHLYNICNKIGVDNRYAIMDLCKYNFS